MRRLFVALLIQLYLSPFGICSAEVSKVYHKETRLSLPDSIAGLKVIEVKQEAHNESTITSVRYANDSSDLFADVLVFPPPFLSSQSGENDKLQTELEHYFSEMLKREVARWEKDGVQVTAEPVKRGVSTLYKTPITLLTSKISGCKRSNTRCLVIMYQGYLFERHLLKVQIAAFAEGHPNDEAKSAMINFLVSVNETVWGER